ncbi:hypothetical protein VTH82DRAFT_8237 [Thermothelomyces myriococcoides]
MDLRQGLGFSTSTPSAAFSASLLGANAVSEPPAKRARLDQTSAPDSPFLRRQRSEACSIGPVGTRAYSNCISSLRSSSYSPASTAQSSCLSAPPHATTASTFGARPGARVPIPFQNPPLQRPQPSRTVSTVLPSPRITTTPIPAPVTPPPVRSNGSNRPNGARPAPHTSQAPAKASKNPPVVIVIDDDDDDNEIASKPPAPPAQQRSARQPPAQQQQQQQQPGEILRPKASESPSALPGAVFRPYSVVPRMPLSQSSQDSPSALAIRSPQAVPPKLEPSTSPNKLSALPIARSRPVKDALPIAFTEERQSKQHDWRAEAHASVWRGRGTGDSASTWFTLRRRPYVTAAQRELIVAGTRGFIGLNPTDLAHPVAFHVDFSADEIKYLQLLTRRTLGLPKTPKKDSKKDLYKVLKRNPAYIPAVLDAFERKAALPGRVREDVSNLIRDLLDQKTISSPTVLSVQRDSNDQRGGLIRSSRVHSLLLAREIAGQRGLGSMRRLENFTNEFRKCREEDLEKRAEWTGCAGDIITITWVSNDGFICGTTEHSDAHNQQYNKPGNLVLGSCSEMTLRAYPEHRIVRPIVEKGENSTEAMRQSQDPWLYSSVVSSDYDAAHDRAYTSSFDQTVKIWKVDPSGASMALLGEWRHEGNVNLVAVSKHESGMVATAADVATDAVRVYDVDPTDISGSPFRSYSCSRVTDEKGKEVSTDKWAYYPATMQWGRAPGVRHLLLVGYSPRSRTGDDNDIPEERRDSGELCLWDGITGERWRLTSATTQNVFEVLWHPTQDSFIAATSPLGLDVDSKVRTQIRVFRPADRDQFGIKAFSPIITLDCPAVDVNELTMMPNSYTFCYVTAGCTDGNIYVWDTALGDKPIHILRHGEPIDEYRGDREREDVGVKFTAWGTTPDRFYTGSSDGVVKVWNIRSLKKPLVRNLLEAPAPVTAGMFSPDKSRLVIGDASGRVFMLSINEEKEQPTSVMKVPIPGSPPSFRIIQRPATIIPHPDPPPPTHDAEGRPIVSERGSAIGRAYLDSLQLERHPNPTIGVVQGPRYAETNLFCRDAHLKGDPRLPLLARWEAIQQEAWKPPRSFLAGRRWHYGIALRPPREVPGLGELHARNKSLDLVVDEMTRLRLEKVEGVDWELGEDYLLREED